MVELFPVIFDYLKQVGGPQMTERMFTACAGRTTAAGTKWTTRSAATTT